MRLPIALTLPLLGLSIVTAAAAQEVRAAQDQGPPISELQIALRDMVAQQQLGHLTVLANEVLEMKVGDRVRLRMVAIPAERHRAPRYPSTRFSILSGGGRVSLGTVREEEGSAIVTAVRSELPSNSRVPTVIKYELLEPLNLPANLREGTVTIDVVADQPAPEVPPASASTVTLYTELDYQGRSQEFPTDARSLSRSLVGNDAVRSARVPAGCRLTLYGDADFRGEQTVLVEDTPDLSRTRVGNDRASSVRVECGGGGQPVTVVTLYSETDFQGRSETFYQSDQTLRDNRIGNDAARSVRIPAGCRVTLYDDAGMRGESTLVTEDVPDLSRTRVGNDRVSSLRVECQGR